MTFLNSALLAALTLGLIPILIHLLNRQRFKQVDFPTLRFLREMQRRKMWQVRIRQIILLILRTLAVLFLVLAITRPVIQSAASILPGVGARTTAVLILDRSASMQTETPSGNRYRDLQTRAQEILALMGDGDEVQIVWADEKPVLFPESPTSHVALLREAVMESRPSLAGGNLAEALGAARGILGRSQNLHKEVYLLSDLSGSAWPADLPEVELLPEDARLFVLPPDRSAIRNLGISDARVISRLITPGRPVALSFTAVNTGSAPVEDRIVSVYLEGRRVAQTRVSLDEGQRQEFSIRFVPEQPGTQTGYVRIEDADAFAPDDRREFVLRVPAGLQVALVGANGPARDLTALALNPMNDPDGFIQVSSFVPAEFETADWSGFDAIFVVDVAEFGIGFGPRVREFVELGKGVLAMAGPTFDLRANQSWLSELGMPGLAEVIESVETPMRWEGIDMAHPLFEGLFEEEPSGISPDVVRAVSPGPGGSAIEIVGLSSGAPFMLESKAGRGRALLLLSSPDPSWSSLFRTGIFPPLMVSGAAYLSGVGTSGIEFQQTIGQAGRLQFAGRPGDEGFELKRMDESFALRVESGASGYAVQIPALESSGGFELWQGNRRIGALVANMPAAESEILPTPGEAYEEILGGLQMRLSDADDVEGAILEGRFGRELWKLCLYIALGLLVLEMLIGRVGKREAAVATT